MQVENLYSRGSERLLEFKPVNEVILKVHFGLVKFKDATSNWVLLDVWSLCLHDCSLSPCNLYIWLSVLANTDCTLQYTVACHPLQIHEVPTIVSMMENLFLQILRNNYSGNNTLNVPSSLHASTHPLPYETNSNSFAYVVVLMTAMGLMFIPSIFCAQVHSFLPTGCFRASSW